MAGSNFVDYVKIFFRSGKGGGGSMHFLRTRGNPRGGPDGGDGGKGGDIIIKGNSHFWTLLHLKYTKHLFAEDGESGGRNRCIGADGKDIVVEVPLGTIVRDAETMQIEGEVTQHGETYTVLKGGRGGLGNDHFKTATNQAPHYAQPGEPAIEAWKILELKILADVGLVGFPNAGKSTLLSVVSAAKPEIADYPFTTIVPNLGMVSYRDGKSFIMADIPGIIEGAAEGKGLGLRFLRHIERNSVLLFTIPIDSNDIKKEYKILCNELKKHNKELMDKKHILAITKCDLADDEIIRDTKKLLPKGIPAVFISSATNKGLTELKDVIWKNIIEE